MSTGVFKRILFCTDFSENADRAFVYAVQQARYAGNAEIFLLHVIPEPDAQFWKTYIYDQAHVDRKARHDIDEKIAATYRARLPSDMRLEPAIRIGAAAVCILEHAVEIKADLLVVGRQGSGALGRVLFGNVPEKLLRKSACAVLVVP